jgi:2-oxo-4-hydroxy-4-carboxy-5-ureidoimidazoline decarboxylase
LTLEELNALSPEDASKALERCCGSTRWLSTMVALRPFPDAETLLSAASQVWNKLNNADWIAAFQHHPRIGDADALRKKFAATREWATAEQAGTAGAPEETLKALAEENKAYENKFGYTFVVSATGKSADEILAILRSRLPNELSHEIRIAAVEQEKITRLRLEKLLAP